MKAVIAVFSLLMVVIHPGFAQDRSGQLRSEEELDYHRKWLNEDVVYIITSEEKQVFQELTTAEEREQFIEQFWFRRDPDPTTAENEFKEEHYRRIAYANDRFSSGIPGWRSDRGRIYIIHGEPAEIDAHPNVGNYNRTLEEGGGATTAFPFEIWRYREIEGLGTNIEIEFVDPTMSGEYRLALRPEDKDALLFTPGAGLTLAETTGEWGKADRPYFNPGNRERYPYMSRSSSTNPFSRYELLTKIQAPTSLKYRDFKEMVQVNVDYDSLPLQTEIDYFRLGEEQALITVTVQLDNKFMRFEREGDHHVAKLAIYGVVTSMTNRVVAEFEEDLVSSYPSNNLDRGLREASVYQKVLVLENRQRYKLDLIAKDLNSGQFGVRRTAINVSAQTDGRLEASSLILSGEIRTLEAPPGPNDRFVLGDLKVLPNISGVFSPDGAFWVYLHLYHFVLNETTLAPDLEITYAIAKDGEIVKDLVDAEGESIQYASAQRAVLTKSIPINDLTPGKYTITIKVADRIKGETVSVRETFRLANPESMAQVR